MTGQRKEKIAPFHLAILIYMTQVGIAILTLPRLLAETFGYNGWLFLLVCSAVVAIHILLIMAVYRMGGGRSIFDILEKSIPKLLLAPFYLGMAFTMSLLASLAIKEYVLIFQMLAFPATHPMFFAAVVSVLVWLLVVKSIYNISKAVTVFFWMLVWMFLLLLFFAHEFEWARLTPFVFQEGTWSFEGILGIFTAFLGYEMALFLFPYAERKHFFKAVYAGHLATTVGYLLVCLVCFGFFSLGQLKKVNDPLLELLSYVRFPFIERIENLLFGLFLITAMLTAVMYNWAATETARRLLPKVQPRWITGGMLAINFLVSWIPQNILEVGHWLNYFALVEILLVITALPLILILLLAIQNRKGAKQHA